MQELNFHEALATQPDWVRLWVGWLNIVTFGTLVVCLIARRTWVVAGAILAVNLPMVASMFWLYEEVGFVRLLGLPHLVFWTPLVVWIVLRLTRRPEIVQPQRAVLWLFVASLTVSLAFDLTDVARYLAGERQSLVPSAG